jgi:hypothetical protein
MKNLNLTQMEMFLSGSYSNTGNVVNGVSIVSVALGGLLLVLLQGYVQSEVV